MERSSPGFSHPTSYPPDLFFHVFEYLPIQSLFRCEGVCRAFKNLAETRVRLHPWFKGKDVHRQRKIYQAVYQLYQNHCLSPPLCLFSGIKEKTFFGWVVKRERIFDPVATEQRLKNLDSADLLTLHHHRKIFKIIERCGLVFEDVLQLNLNRFPFQINRLLIDAVLCGHVEAVRYFLKKGADPDCSYHCRDLFLSIKCVILHTPLIQSVADASLVIASLLLDYHADRNKGGRYLIGPRHLKHPDSIAFTPPLVLSAYLGRSDFVRLLLQEGADPNLPAEDGRTALHFAALRRSFADCEILVRHGADANAKDVKGKTPLDMVRFFTYNLNQSIATLLRENGGI